MIPTPIKTAAKMEVLTDLHSLAEFRFNLFTGRVEFRAEHGRWRPVTEKDLNTISYLLGKKYSPTELHTALNSDFTDDYHPVASFLSENRWDGDDHLEQLCSLLKVDDSEYAKRYIIKWFVSMVAASMGEGVIPQTVLVLSGAQGIGKTTYLSRMVPGSLQPYKSTGYWNPESKDSRISMAECIMINLDELEVMNKSSAASLKEAITLDRVNIRRPYGRFSENLPRIASFTGTTNEKIFLRDSTGSRRFIVLVAEDIDLKTPVNIEQCWAQAWQLYQDGFDCTYSKAEIQEIQNKNSGFEVPDSELDLVLKYFDVVELDDADMLLSATEVVRYIEKEEGATFGSSAAIRFGRAMMNYGFKRKKLHSSFKYALRKVKPANAPSRTDAIEEVSKE